MAKGLVSDTNLTAIANAIRSKNGSSDRYTPSTMAQAISDIPTSQVDQTTALQYMLNNKTDYTGIAAGLTTLTELPTFTQPAGVTNFDGAFSGCSSITASGIAGMNMSSGTNFSNTFRDCTSLTSLPNGLDLALAKSSDGTFYGCTGLTGELTFGKGSSSLTSRANMFYGCSGITTVTFASGAYGFGNMDNMFDGCTNLRELSLTSPSYYTYDSNGSRAYTFRGCTNLTTVPAAVFNSSVRSYYGTFYGCTALTSLSNVNLSGAVNVSYMFYRCTALTSVTLSPGGRSKICGDFGRMFSGCTNLTTVNTSVFNFSNKSSNMALQKMFESCPSLDNATLNGLLGALSTFTGTTNKNLKYIGLSSTQATTCTTLSNWAALSAAGWTTGY